YGDIVLEVGDAAPTEQASTFALNAGAEGGSEPETAKQGVVTLGSEYHASKGTFDGSVIVNEGAQLAVVENGEYIVKNIELNGSGAEANVEGKLNTSSLNSTGGIVDVSGDLSADTMTAQNSALEVSGKLNTGAMQATGSTLKVSGEASSSSLDASGSAVEVSGKLSTGSMTADGGSLNVGAEGSVQAADITATGKKNVTISGELTAAGTLDVSSKSGSKKQVDIDGAVASGKLVADANTVINVGSSSAAGSLTVAEADLGGAAVFLDPAWKDDPSKNIIENASHAIFAGNTVTGRLTAGQNSLLVLGDDSADAAIAAFNASGRSWQNEAKAAIAIMSPQTIESTGSLLADGTLTTTSDDSKKFAATGTAEFRAGSMLLVDAAGAASGSTPALLGNGEQLIVEEGAKLYLHGAEEGKNYNVIGGFTTVDSTDPTVSTVKGWQEEDLVLNRKLTGDISFEGGKIGIFTEKADIAALYPDLLIRNAVDTFAEDSTSSHMGLRFLSLATNPTLLGDGEFVGTVNESARAAITAGVQNTALRIADAASNTVLDHMSLAQHDGSRDIHSGGVDFWAAPIYGNLY
ncbi:MAG: hypothetical protein IJZ18_02280, partial [Mailhella sp.]|nr:hypothetical protein [Mailhella sp.]